MKPKTIAVIAYITWIGWLVAFLKRDKGNAFCTRHINQALTLNLAGIVANWMVSRGGLLSAAGSILDLGILILAILGIVRAAQESAEPLPVIGEIEIIR